MIPPTRPANPHAAAWKGFTEQTTEHELHIIHDDGLYKHLRVQAPGTRMWSWDITTWPGHLATSGDIADGFMFTRELDMIGFFTLGHGGRGRDSYHSDGAPSIDVRYWAEKLCGGRSQEVKVYDSAIFLQLVREHLAEDEDLGDEAQIYYTAQRNLLKKLHTLRGLDETASQTLLTEHWNTRKAVSGLEKIDPGLLRSTPSNVEQEAQKARQVLWNTDDLTDAQHEQLLQDLDHGLNWFELADTDVDEESPAERREEIFDEARWHSESEYEAHTWLSQNEQHVGGDTFEWDLREYDIHFLFTCYAIDMAVRLYREQKTRG